MKYLGIILGGLYGLAYRSLAQSNSLEEYYSISSITFVWILPIAISIIPLLVAKKEIGNKKTLHALLPVLSVFLFFVFSLTTRLEDLLCILIISIPHLIVALIVGLIAGAIINRKDKNKLYSILLIPLILNPLESLLPESEESFSISSSILINSSTSNTWKYIIEVPEIKDSEYEPGFFNVIGVPRPIRSELNVINGKEYRIGYFTDGLELVESITSIDKEKYVVFKIHMDRSKLRDVPMDNHILKSDFFHFESISYTLNNVGKNKTELQLNCDYRIRSKMHAYANFWAELVIQDFEKNLLNVLKKKIENHLPL